jgi:hypothetical protein
MTFGISCVKDLLQYHELVVEHSTDIARLKRDASAVSHDHEWLRAQASDTVVIFNATLLTMNTGNPARDLIPGGILVSRGGVIDAVGALENFVVPGGSTVINAHRGTQIILIQSFVSYASLKGYVIPGFIDVHAHWDGFAGRYPATSWEMETFLAYGVTTLHK